MHLGRKHLVVRAQSSASGRAVVLKLALGDPPSPRAVAALHREHGIVARMDHPAVVQSLGLVQVGGGVGLVLADAGPLTLRERLRAGALSPGDFLPMALELSRALAHVHERGIVHRDVNPANIVLSGSAPLTLIDFGLARPIEAGERGEAGLDLEARDPTPLLDGPLGGGTLPYLAPEQTGRTSAHVDHRTDLYALGVTFYEMLSGAPPFVVNDTSELLHAHLAREPEPLSMRARSVPLGLSAIVMRLLAKAPEDRYQSAGALEADLLEAERRLRRTGHIERFVLGAADAGAELPIPRRLYGREAQVDVLRRALAAAVDGRSACVVLEGPSGVGKSRLAVELRAPTRARGGTFAAASFVEGPAAPFGAIGAALRAALRPILAAGDAELQRWRGRIARSLAGGALALAEVVPEAIVLLEQGEPVLPGSSGIGLGDAIVRLVAALARPEHPLVLVLDDAHSADEASLRLLVTLLASPEVSHLLVVLACRPDGDGRCETFLGALRREGVTVRRLRVEALGPSALVALCCDTLQCEPQEAARLSELLLHKTGGNPAELQKILSTMRAKGIVRYDAGASRWSWDAGALERLAVSDGVATQLCQRQAALLRSVQRVLGIVACFDAVVDVEQLREAARAMGVEGSVEAALASGLLLPAEEVACGRRAVRFAHEQVRREAAAALPEEDRQACHAHIGWLLLERSGQGARSGEPSSTLYDALHHLERGLLAVRASDRVRLSELGLRAGLSARSVGAHAVAARLLRAGVRALPPDAFSVHHELAFTLHREAARSAYLTGEHRAAGALVAVALAQAGTAVELARVRAVELVRHAVAGDLPSAVAAAREGLAALGHPLPGPAAVPGAAAEERAAVRVLFGGDPEDAARLRPALVEEGPLAAAELLGSLWISAASMEPELRTVVASRLARLALDHGEGPHTPLALVAHGTLLAAEGEEQRGYAAGVAALRQAEQWGDDVTTRVLAQHAAHLAHWGEPARDARAMLRRAFRRALDLGALAVTCQAAVAHVAVLLPLGAPLDQALGDCADARTLLAGVHSVSGREAVRTVRAAIQRLRGGEAPAEGEDVAATDPSLLYLHGVLEARLAYTFGDAEAAVRWSEWAAPWAAHAPSSLLAVDHALFAGLALARRIVAASGDDRERLVRQASAHERALRRFGAVNPESFGHKAKILAAELLAARGRDMRALQMLDEAAELAHRSGFVHDEALANELAGQIAARAGRRRMADVYLSAAVRCYQLWGAVAKADALLLRWPFIAAAGVGLDGSSSTTHTTEGRAGASVDLPSVLKAARALSEEVYLDRLLARMMTVVLEVGGAERGAFLLRTDTGLVVRAQAQVGPEEQSRVEETPLESSVDVPAGPVLLASRTREPVVIADALQDEHFAHDPVVKARRIRAAVALPVTKQGRLLGVLYLENDRIPGVFTGARVDLLGLLSAQIAIALENSVLFERLRQEVSDREAAEAELLALNQSLEARVRERTAELFATNAELARSNEDLELFASIVSHDLHEPLRTMTGFTEALARRYDGVLDGDGRRYAQLVVDGGRRMQRMLRGLLEVSRVRSAARPLEPTDLSAVLDEVLVSLEAVIGETGALVTCDPLPTVLADATQLLQVFQNLVANALKFAGPRPPRVHIGVSHEGARVRISVRDEGIGIDERDVDRIFRIFHRAQSGGVAGSGIGLSVARKIVERHGGRIWVETAVGRGATFYFTLPAA